MQNIALVIWIGEGEEYGTDPDFPIDAHRYVFYPSEIIASDCFEYRRYEKEVQDGRTVSERLFNGVRRMFDYRFEKVVLLNGLGLKLPGRLVQQAFNELDEYDVVFVPSGTGNIKLLAMKKPLLRIFKDEVWRSEELVLDLMLLMKEKGISYQII